MKFIDEEIFLLDANDYRVMPWRNGGGTTREIVAYPADTEEFHWRLSIADIETDGDFSSFPGCARTIVLLEGNGMRLKIDGAVDVDIDQKFQPLDFNGGKPTHCTLLDGPVRDLNIMSSGDHFSHATQVIDRFPHPLPPDSHNDAVALFALQGELRVQLDSAPRVVVPEHATLLLAAPERLLRVNARQASRALWVGLRRVSS